MAEPEHFGPLEFSTVLVERLNRPIAVADIQVSLGDLLDVTLVTATSGDALMHDGSVWANRPLVEADITDLGSYITTLAFGGLSDVTATEGTRFVPAWSGSAWVGRALVEADISDLSHTGAYSHPDPMLFSDGNAGAPAWAFAAAGQQDVGAYRKGTDSIGWSTGGVERFYISSGGTFHVLDDITFDTDAKFINNQDGNPMWGVNQSGVTTDIDNLDFLPNMVYVEPSNLTSFTENAWTEVPGTNSIVWDHVGTNRTIYVQASGVGRFRETAAVAYNVGLRVEISIDGGSTWSTGTEAQGYVGTGTGGGGYRENMASLMQVSGTATGDAKTRLMYFVATGNSPDGLDHMAIMSNVAMNH